MTDFYSDELESYLIKPYGLNESAKIAIRYHANAEEDKNARVSDNREYPYEIRHPYSAFKALFNVVLKNPLLNR